MSDDDDTPKCLMAKGCKVKSRLKLLGSDSDSGCESILKGISKNVMSKIKKTNGNNRESRGDSQEARGLAHP